jgi:hypothetical protein
MRKLISAATSLFFMFAAAHTGRAIEMTWEYSVQVSATVQASPAQITLSWPQDQYMLPNSYTVYRKGLTDTSWGNGVNLPGTATSYTDSNVQAGQAYEYQIVKVTSQYTGYGYIYSGINVPMTDSRGKLLLVVDNTYAAALSNELAQLQQDLTGDGWTVIRLNVNRTDPVTSVKSRIVAQYHADPANVQAVFLFGHVPVPYSGNIVPDGHTPDHQGAWPCDGYYGDMDGVWTDNSVNVTGQYDPRNTNVPGDGKFDQSTFPAPIKLMVGRVDLANMPGVLWNGGPSTFPSELDLLRNYLTKDHRFRTKQFDLPRRGIVGDFFGVRSGEAFAASGWRNFSTFFGASNVTMTPTNGTWTPTLHSNPYLWAYGCGAGSFTSIAGLGNSDSYNDLLTRELWTNDVQAVFTLLFGSWLGDWDSQDNIMRGVLALPSYGLTCAWSGRPHWFMQHMALGMPIGYSARLTQNNGPNGLYQNQINSAAGEIHIGLMGDPTLRMHVVAPPGAITATTNGGQITLNWTASSDSVLGYHVYRAGGTNGFTRLTTTPITGTSYTDASASGAANYMVRAVKLETSASGTYYNPSIGTFLTSVGSTGYIGGTTNPPGGGGGGTSSNTVVWVDDTLPAGAVPGTDGGDAWTWVSSNPTPYSGTVANQSTLAAGLHQHYFSGASQTLTVNTGDVLFAYVYLDPANPPSEVMLQWNNGTWDHRAYWGANNIAYGTPGTTTLVNMGALPTAGQWVLLEVPASQVGLEGSTLNGAAFSQYDGRATWDYAGKSSSAIVTPPGGGGGGTNTNTPPTTLTNIVSWVDDSLPAGAVPGSDFGDAWNWVSSNPTPYSGTVANQSTISAGLHQHYFSGATQTLTVNTGDVLFAYVYLDPANTPNEIMLQWNNGTWDHRAYWGANEITYGTPGTASLVNMGALPAAGQWVLLQVPASRVGLEGSTLSGMAFSQYNGRATWDDTGKSSSTITNPPGGGGGGTNTNTPPTLTNAVAWVDDSLPPGATPGTDGGDAWNWVNSNPTPYSGQVANQSTLSAGLHQHFFTGATPALNVSTGDVMFASVYLDPANPPNEIMLQWNDGTWEHRAYWGANNIAYGIDGTSSRLYMGALPPVGQWSLLQVQASQVGLQGSAVNGMAFSQNNGRATWDYAGKSSSALVPPPGGGGGGTNTNTPPRSFTNGVTWVDEALPTGAVPGTDGGDSWNWVSSNPTPFSGTLDNQSTIAAGLHQHYFTAATQTLTVNTGDVLFAAVYLDPANMPSEIMLQWNDGSWQHRAFWGADNIGYGTSGTTSRAYMGPLPSAGQWALLQVPASQVALEGSTLNGMAFSQFDGRATWDYAGKTTGSLSITNPITNPPPPGSTNTAPTNIVVTATNSLPGATAIDYITPQLPQIGDNSLHVLSPSLLELNLINTKAGDPAQVAQWNFVSGGQFTPPPTSAFQVTVNGQVVNVTQVGFKRRPLSAPMANYDLRIANSLYLQLSAPVSDNQTVQVTNPDGSLWSSSTHFVATVDPLRYSPAIHVNEEGYMPNYPKKAMIGYYEGNLGEMSIPASAGFKLVDAVTGNQVFQGTLTQRADVGYTYSPLPYQQVYQADFSSFNTPGQYRLVVPGMGGSLPFLIHSGIAMDFARAHALGLYHQRCGTAIAMPYTRFTHDACHTAPASVPTTAAAYPFTWTTVSNYAHTINTENPTQIAPALDSPSAQLFPFVNQGPVDVSGGHHDAGDYSKYTINSASLVHYLMFAVDSLPGVAALDNLGTPESGDGISDVMQEAKWEADFVAKMQDSDGGFYFLVYPQNREYEGNVTPDHGDPQVVWPKTTSVTAASVAALAQCASSPLFKRTYPAAAALYMQKAQLGWQFLMNAINQHGRTGAYQKITHYGDNFADQDELAWAACQMYLATGDQSIHQLLLSWFDPSNPATWRWGWWHMSECYGHTIRSYAFAVQSGRATAAQLDPTFLAKCQAEIAAAANDMLTFSQDNAYGSSFSTESKGVQSAGWYFSADQAFDLTVAYQLNPSPVYLDAIIANMNYEGGCNPVNVSYVTGLGWKRTRDIVCDWALNDTRVLPPSGILVGNIQGSFEYLWNYGPELEELCFPSDSATVAPYPFYDRWGDSWNVTTEMVVLNQARSLGTLAFLAAQGPYASQAWQAPANATLNLPTTVAQVGSNLNVTMTAPGIDLTGARITWEARDQQPAFGQSFTFAPLNNGPQWVEAEAQFPDGRRVFAKGSFNANAQNIVWVDDSVPAGATAGADSGDSWNWISSNPTPYSGSLAHQSALAAGEHQHFFSGASSTLTISTGDVLYAYIYLDPANMPSEVMLQWNDGSWEHRAYWGGNSLGYGLDGTPSRQYMGALPAAGQWVQLRVPASSVNLEGSTLNGMAFTLYGGRATWDASGRLSQATGFDPTPVAFTLHVTTAGPTLTWSDTPGHLYQVRCKNTLTDAAWTTLGDFTPTTTTTTWTDTSAGAAQRYYEVIQVN